MFLPKNYEYLLLHSRHHIFYTFASTSGEGNEWYKDHPELKAQIQQKHIVQMRVLDEAWDKFIRYFNTCCNEFCRQDPSFIPFLEKVIRFENWKFPKERYTSNTATPQEYKVAGILVKAEKYPALFLNAFYSLYKKIPKGDSGIFLQEVSDEVGQEIVKELFILIDAPLHYELLLWKFYTLIHPRIPRDRSSKPLFPKDYKEVLKDTPLYDLVQAKYPFNLPLKPRLEHQWIVAGTGAGKTQLLQRMICDDIEHGRSVVVIDSQRDMIGKLTRLKHTMEVVYIDPEDIEYPPGIALFDVKFGTGAEAEARETQVIELYEYMFSVFGTELTARQGSLFTYGLRLMFAIPKANIHTLVELFRGDKYQFKRYWENMGSVERDFFDREFFEKKYAANREQILAKLNKILENKTLRRIFSNTESKLDFSTILNRPVAVFINTSQEQLGENGCALFGRFLLSLITNAIVRRSKIPEDQRRPVFLYVDEGRDYGNDDAFERIIYQCRKYKAGLIFCSQNIGQLSQKTVSALFTSSIKFVRAVKEPAETRKLAQSIRVEEDFLHDLDIKDRSHAEWACKIENQKTVKATVNFGYLESQPKIPEQEYQKLREENRRKYCVKVNGGKPAGDSALGSTPKDPPDSPLPTGSGQRPEVGGRDDSIWD
jgi:Type IV secretory system Conjugative DNA transfer